MAPNLIRATLEANRPVRVEAHRCGDRYEKHYHGCLACRIHDGSITGQKFLRRKIKTKVKALAYAQRVLDRYERMLS